MLFRSKAPRTYGNIQDFYTNTQPVLGDVWKYSDALSLTVTGISPGKDNGTTDVDLHNSKNGRTKTLRVNKDWLGNAPANATTSTNATQSDAIPSNDAEEWRKTSDFGTGRDKVYTRAVLGIDGKPQGTATVWGQGNKWNVGVDVTKGIRSTRVLTSTAASQEEATKRAEEYINNDPNLKSRPQSKSDKIPESKPEYIKNPGYAGHESWERDIVNEAGRVVGTAHIANDKGKWAAYATRTRAGGAGKGSRSKRSDANPNVSIDKANDYDDAVAKLESSIQKTFPEQQPQLSPAPEYKVGDKVEIQKGDNWVKGKVVDSKPFKPYAVWPGAGLKEPEPVMHYQVELEDGDKGYWQGRSLRRTKENMSFDGTCICPSCSKEVPHKVGQPCNKRTCPNCGKPMMRVASHSIQRSI